MMAIADLPLLTASDVFFFCCDVCQQVLDLSTCLVNYPGPVLSFDGLLLLEARVVLEVLLLSELYYPLNLILFFRPLGLC